MALESYSYNDQLNWLTEGYIAAKAANKLPTMRMYLSLAQSVKEARDYSLNEQIIIYKKGLEDAAVVVEHTRGRLVKHSIKQALAAGIRLFSKSDVPARRFLYTVDGNLNDFLS